MKTVAIASKNPVKVQATRNAFEQMLTDEDFEFIGVSVPSGVTDQPMSHNETRQGASNRALGAKQAMPAADYWVGIEGGVEEIQGELAGFAWMVIMSRDMKGQSCTGTFFLPPPVAHLIRSGMEMGEADDIVFGQTNSKQQDGAAGLLTHNVINRLQLYEHALILALIPFKNAQLYK